MVAGSNDGSRNTVQHRQIFQHTSRNTKSFVALTGIHKKRIGFDTLAAQPDAAEDVSEVPDNESNGGQEHAQAHHPKHNKTKIPVTSSRFRQLCCSTSPYSCCGAG
jgi:hypothetical protein